jgi:hypothetical protein
MLIILLQQLQDNLDITFDDLTWVNTDNTGCVVASGIAEVDLVGDNGLYATGFTLVETDSHRVDEISMPEDEG